MTAVGTCMSPEKGINPHHHLGKACNGELCTKS